jgi:hypothetical protein
MKFSRAREHGQFRVRRKQGTQVDVVLRIRLFPTILAGARASYQCSELSGSLVDFEIGNAIGYCDSHAIGLTVCRHGTTVTANFPTVDVQVYLSAVELKSSVETVSQIDRGFVSLEFMAILPSMSCKESNPFREYPAYQ